MFLTAFFSTFYNLNILLACIVLSCYVCISDNRASGH